MERPERSTDILDLARHGVELYNVVGTTANQVEMDDDLGIEVGWDVPGERLYRYRRFDVGELRSLINDGRVRLTDASYFNDPWDCRPRLVAEKAKDAADQERIIAEFKATSARVNPGMPQSVIDRAAAIFRSDPTAQQKFYDDRMREYLPQPSRRYPVL